MKTIFTMLAICSMFSAVAQPGNPDKKMGGEHNPKAKAMYIAYMTEQLNLDEQTAEAFWPIQHQMHKDIREIHDQQKGNALALEEAILNVKKKYKDRLVKVLGEERTNLYFIKDHEFRQRMVDRLQKRRMQKKRGPYPMRGDMNRP